MNRSLLFVAFLFATVLVSGRPEGPAASAAEEQKHCNAPISLGPADKPAISEPPAGFDAERADIPHGKTEMAEYPSKSVEVTRRMAVYTPHGYSKDKKYPVVFIRTVGRRPATSRREIFSGMRCPSRSWALIC